MVNTHNFYFLTVSGVLITALMAVAGRYYWLGRRASLVSWEALCAKLTRTDRDVIAGVALDLVDEFGNPRQDEADGLESSELWNLIGGLKGLEVLEKNSEILIDLACYVQQWYPEALPIAEQLRLDSRALQWHLARLRGAAKTGNLEVSFPFYAQRAVATYYVMTRRLLDLYEAANFSRLPELRSTLLGANGTGFPQLSGPRTSSGSRQT